MNLPAICEELRIRPGGDGGNVPLVNSRDVAEFFEKRHDNVLRDINALDISSDLRGSWFRPSYFQDSYGREQPSMDMTRQGFTLLVMGWTGERAMAFKVRYIEAFDAMEKALNEGSPVTGRDLISAVREIVAPLAVRFDGQDSEIERIDKKIDGVASDVAQIKDCIVKRRRRPNEDTKRELLDAVAQLGCLCPCGCGRTIVIGGVRFNAEYDHFYAVDRANVGSMWLISKPCHREFTDGKRNRHEYEAAFRHFHHSRSRLPGRQGNLF